MHSSREDFSGLQTQQGWSWGWKSVCVCVCVWLRVGYCSEEIEEERKFGQEHAC